MFLRSFRSKALGRLTSCIKYLVWFSHLRAQAFWHCKREKAHSSWGHIHVKDTGDGLSTKGPIFRLLLAGRLDEVTSKAACLKIQDLIELFMVYRDWASRPLSEPWQQGSAFPAATIGLSACHSAHCHLESAKCLTSATCSTVQLGETVLKTTHGSQSPNRQGSV